MKHFKQRPATLLAVLGSAVLAGGSWAAESTRVYVNFKPGQKAVAKGLIQSARGTVHHEFDHLNAFATTLPSAAVAALSKNPSITLVEEDPPRFLFSAAEQIPYGIDLVQASKVWDFNNDGVIDSGAPTGAGIKVGVIDSGVFSGHEDFFGVNLSGYNGNLPWNADGSGHGTHVSGTIAAAAYNGKGVVGVSPGTVSLYMVRVFGDDGNWAYSSSLLNAAQQCQAAGCKIISMSLGGGRASKTEQNGFNSLYNNGNGILLIAAAGNDGTTATSYPAGYSSVVSVAAVDAAKTVADFSQKNADVELSGPGVGVLSTVPYVELNSAVVGGVTIEGGPIEFAARGTAVGPLVDGGLGDTVGAWTGKVVLIQRGTTTFLEKVQNAQSGGAVAVIIYNNTTGDFSGTLGAGNTSSIPAISVSDTVGATLLGQLNQTTTVTSSFESGVSGYAYYDGTSMATPHVSGVAALVWSAKTTATAGAIRTALQTTALDLGLVGRDPAYGFGLVQAKDAITALLSSGGGGGSSDTTAPAITAVTASVVNAKQGTFKIAWTTDEASTSTVSFVGGATTSNTTLVTAHSLSFRGTKGATYTYSVSSTDAAGNTRTAGPFVFVNLP
jgi:subtilisin family serine protease